MANTFNRRTLLALGAGLAAGAATGCSNRSDTAPLPPHRTPLLPTPVEELSVISADTAVTAEGRHVFGNIYEGAAWAVDANLAGRLKGQAAVVMALAIAHVQWDTPPDSRFVGPYQMVDVPLADKVPGKNGPVENWRADPWASANLLCQVLAGFGATRDIASLEKAFPETTGPDRVLRVMGCELVERAKVAYLFLRSNGLITGDLERSTAKSSCTPDLGSQL